MPNFRIPWYHDFDLSFLFLVWANLHPWLGDSRFPLSLESLLPSICLPSVHFISLKVRRRRNSTGMPCQTMRSRYSISSSIPNSIELGRQYTRKRGQIWDVSLSKLNRNPQIQSIAVKKKPFHHFLFESLRYPFLCTIYSFHPERFRIPLWNSTCSRTVPVWKRNASFCHSLLCSSFQMKRRMQKNMNEREKRRELHYHSLSFLSKFMIIWPL